MKSFTSGVAKRLALSLVLLGAVAGCAVVPYNSGYYGQPAYYDQYGYYDQPAYAPVYTAPPVYVSPAINFGFGYSSYGHRSHGRGFHHRR